jgi:5'-AMP-activated protein kinase regulatory beta subunit
MVIHDKKHNEMVFVCNSTVSAKKVFLAGDFNNWDPQKNRMTKSKDGTYRARVKLSPGKYQYKFFADGSWVDDPDADKVKNEFGTTNSVVQVP